MVYRTIRFTRMSPGGGLDVGVDYPIIDINGVSVIVDSNGKYHEEGKIGGWRLMNLYAPVYDIKVIDSNGCEIK